MENHDYEVYKVEQVSKHIPRVPDKNDGFQGASGDTVPGTKEETSKLILTIVAPKGTLGEDLIRVHMRHKFSYAPESLVSWKILDAEPIHTVIRYDDRYRGQV